MGSIVIIKESDISTYDADNIKNKRDKIFFKEYNK
jgi:hypothetical protein